MLKTKSRTKRFPSVNEDGLSTLEWILIVAAVGGLATLGVFIVRNATDASSEQVDGETDQTMVALMAEAEAKIDRALRRLTKNMRRGGYNYPRNRADRCYRTHNWESAVKQHWWNSEGVWNYDSDGNWLGNIPGGGYNVEDLYGDTFSFGWKLDLDNDGVIDPWTKEREQYLVDAGLAANSNMTTDLIDTDGDGVIDRDSGICGATLLIS